MTDLKTCSKCKEEKLRSGFYKNKRHKDGLAYECKACHYVRVKKCRQKKPEHYKKLAREYQARPEVKARLKEYRARPEVKAKLKKRQQTEEYKASARRRMKARYKTAKHQAWLKEYHARRKSEKRKTN